MPSMSVIICCHTDRRWDRLRAAIDASRSQAGPADRIVVVVDNDDALARRLEERFDAITVVRHDGPPGVSGARNAGVARCDTDVVVFLDDDATPAPHWLRELRRGFDRADTVAVGGHVEPDWAGERPCWFPHEFDWVVGCSYRGLPDDGATIRNPIGANMAVRHDALLEAGRFDTSTGRVGADGSGCDETELFIRIARQRPDVAVRLASTAVVHHEVPADRASIGYFVRRCVSEGRSKAAMTRRTGTAAGLSSERRYVVRVLPGGVACGVRDACRGDLSGLGRAAAIILGLAATSMGFVRGSIAQRGDRW